MKSDYVMVKLTKRQIIVSIAVIICVIVAALFLFIRQNDQNTDILGQSTSINNYLPVGKSVNFQALYIEADQEIAGFKLDTESVQFDKGVLFYSFKDSSGRTITVSQQKVPAEFSGRIPQGDEKVETAYGVGGISLLPDRTTVNILSNDGVFILINADVAVSIDSVKTIARSLTN